MEIRELGKDELGQIYREHMENDFPDSELKPLKVIVNGMMCGMYACYAFMEGERLCAYTVLMRIPSERTCLMDYFAVCQELRGKGIGTRALNLLRTAIEDTEGILIEYENPEDDEGESSQAERKRREVFYRKAGMRRTEIDVMLYGVHYCIGYLSCCKDAADDTTVKRSLMALYQTAGYKEYCFLDCIKS